MHEIDLTQILNQVIEIIGSIATPILLVFAYKWLNLSQDSESRKVVAGVIENGIALAESQATAFAKTHGKLTVTDENVAKVAGYVLPKVQESLSRLNVKDDQLGEIIAAKIAARQAPPTVVSAPAPATVTVKPEGA